MGVGATRIRDGLRHCDLRFGGMQDPAARSSEELRGCPNLFRDAVKRSNVDLKPRLVSPMIDAELEVGVKSATELTS